MRIKMNRFLSGIAVLLSLTVFSCGDIGTELENMRSPSAGSTIKLQLDEGNMRTAFPEVTKDAITQFTLEGAIGDAAATELGTWASDNGETAYAKMIASELAIAAGTWKFTLTAICEQGGIQLAKYVGTLEKEIGAGQNGLQFTLKLDSVNVNSEAGKGKLTINIVLGVANRVKKITGTLYESDRSSLAAAPAAISTTDADSDGYVDVSTAESPYVYTVNELPAGVYVAKFDFYADDAGKSLLGSCTEAVNINLLGASSTVTVKTLDSVYGISYYEWVLDSADTPKLIAEDAEATNTNQSAYTRLDTIDLAAPTKTGYTFWKWVELTSGSDTVPWTAAGIEQIARKTVGDKKLCAIFLPDAEVPQVNLVEVTGTAKVGQTLTMTPKVGDEAFGGTIVGWQWYSAGSADAEEWTAISSATAAAYVVKPEFAGKYLKAKAVQKYTIAKENGKITTVTKNAADSSNAVASDPTSVVAKGTLVLDNISLKYDAVPVRGASLLAANFKVEAGALKDATTDWTYDAPTVTYTGSGNAPSDSSKSVSGIPVKFSVAGYDDFTPDGGLSVFINVKYATPSTETVKALLNTNYATITFGKFAFLQTAVEDGIWEYNFTGSSGTAVALDATEHAYSATTDGSIWVRLKTVGTKDAAGYIGASDYTQITISSPSELGTKVLLASVSLSGTEEFGNKLTATAAPDIEGQSIVLGDGKGSITWTWSVGDTELQKEERTYSATSTYEIRDASIVNTSPVIVTASYRHVATAQDIVKTAQTSGAIGKGSLTADPEPTYSYTEEPVVVGTTLDKTKISRSGSYKNGLGDTIEPSSSNYTLDLATAPNATGNVTLKVNVPGYKELTYSVRIEVMKAAPSAAGMLSEEKDTIPLGAILFKPSDWDKLEFRYSDDDAQEAESWHDVPPATAPLYKKDGAAFAAGNMVHVRYKATETTSASRETLIKIVENNIGTRMTTVSIVSIDADPSLTLTASGSTLTVSGAKAGATCKWYVDRVLQEETSASLELNAPVTGTYSVTVMTQNALGDDVSATATVKATVN